MKVLVTGAAGYIGRHVINTLLSYRHDVTAVDIVSDGFSADVKYLNEDIFSGDKDIFKKAGCPDLCIHLAWKDGFSHNSPAHIDNLAQHYHFLCDLIDAGCKRIAVMGTMHEIGFWEGKIDENTACNPMSLYGIAKNSLRQALLLYAQNKPVHIYWLRAYYILGDDIKNHSVFTKILQAAEEGKKEFPFTSGQAKYDFISVDELAEQIVLASTQDKYTGIINVCSGKPVSLAEKVEKFIKEKNLDIILNYGEFPDRPYDSKIVYGDNTIIQEILKNSRQSGK